MTRAKLKDGTEVDLLRRGAPVDFNRPAVPTRVYPNYYWQKLFREMAYYDEQGFQVFRAPVARYMCRHWNEGHAADKQVVDFEFIYCMESGKTPENPAGAVVMRETLVHLDYSGPWLVENTPSEPLPTR